MKKHNRAKRISPWTPGSVSPIPYRPGAPDPDNETYDRPIPIRELAKIHRVRWYRDACGDDYIPGKYGEIFRYGIGKLGVQIGGPRANNTKTEVPAGSNKRGNAVELRYQWPISQGGGEGEVIFIAPESEIETALTAISSYKMPRGGIPPNDPEARARGLAAIRNLRQELSGTLGGSELQNPQKPSDLKIPR